jgi:hypothetical protein
VAAVASAIAVASFAAFSTEESAAALTAPRLPVLRDVFTTGFPAGFPAGFSEGFAAGFVARLFAASALNLAAASFARFSVSAVAFSVASFTGSAGAGVAILIKNKDSFQSEIR